MFQRWLRWFKQIREIITDLAHKRRIYREVTAIIEANPRLQVPSAFYDWMQRAYVADMVIGIRSLVDWHPHSISLVKLLQEIEDHTEVLSRARFVGKYKSLPKKFGHRDFDRFARLGSPHIDRSIIRRHRRELIDSQRRLRKFANKHLAHRSIYKMRRLPTYSELDACVDLLEKLLKTYTLLLEQAALVEVVPVIQYDWLAPFRVQWIEDAKEDFY